jgi:predicted dehydrogenase
MGTYTVLVVGMGKRGRQHAAAFRADPSFELVGICNPSPAALREAAAQLGNPRTGTDPALMAAELRPDVFCFCTPPQVRLELIEIAISGGAKLIAFEKPIALTSAETFAIRDALRASGVKAVVSHQHRYGRHYQAVHDIIAGGELGRVHTVYATATGWMTHLLSHLIDYTMWFNGYAPGQWAMAQAAGGSKLTDSHPSPDYIGGFVQYANGVRGVYECGVGAPDQPEVAKWWGKNRIGAQGTEGFAEVLTGGGWRAVTASGGCRSGAGAMDYAHDMPPYVAEIAAWLDDDAAVHPCDVERAYLGAEVVFALQRSAALGGQVALPLGAGADEQTMLNAAVAGTTALGSCPQNLVEFGSA